MKYAASVTYSQSSAQNMLPMDVFLEPAYYNVLPAHVFLEPAGKICSQWMFFLRQYVTMRFQRMLFLETRNESGVSVDDCLGFGWRGLAKAD